MEAYISGIKQKNLLNTLNNDFYDFREDIDLNVEELSNFKPYLDYIILRTNNESGINYSPYSNLDFDFNLDRIRFVKSYISNPVIKSKILRYIAFEYLLKDNPLIDIDSFLNEFLKISIDDKINIEIEQLYSNISLLQIGKTLPEIELTNEFGDSISSIELKLNKPIIVGHSLGGMCSVIAASQFKNELYGLVIVDTAILPPSEIPDKFDLKIKANKTYQSIDEAKSRFRLVPSQGNSLDYIMDYIAEKSLRKTDEGWTWKFDPSYMKIFNTDGFRERQAILSEKLARLECRVAVFRGEKSMLFSESASKYMRELTNKKTPIIAIPEAHHHIMVDQPLALISALRALVTDWDHSNPAKAD